MTGAGGRRWIGRFDHAVLMVLGMVVGIVGSWRRLGGVVVLSRLLWRVYVLLRLLIALPLDIGEPDHVVVTNN